MWQARTKTDLIIEVWEKLDCENVGSVEIEAIEVVIAAEYGQAAVESPMAIARLLADEGADLRHSEIMELWVRRASDQPYAAAFRNIVNIKDLRAGLRTIRDLESLRRKYRSEGDREGLRLAREAALSAKRKLAETVERPSTDVMTRQISIELTQWLTLWLQTPEMFEDWIALRERTGEFIDRFGKIGNE